MAISAQYVALGDLNHEFVPRKIIIITNLEALGRWIAVVEV
jgi:hypothetical protein